jgi:hypothetical protein
LNPISANKAILLHVAPFSFARRKVFRTGWQ